MANLTQGIPLNPYGQGGRQVDLPLKAATQVYGGGMAAEIAGAACPASAAGAGPVVGVYEYDMLGGASDGTTRVRITTDKIFIFAAGVAAPTDATPLGAPLFAEDDNHVGTGGLGATQQLAGRFAGMEDNGLVRVYIDFRTASAGDGRVVGANIANTATSTVQRQGRLTVYAAPTLSQPTAVTLGTTGAVAGDVIRINRSDTSANALSVVNGGVGAGTLAALVASKVGFAQAYFDGTNWSLDGVSAT